MNNGNTEVKEDSLIGELRNLVRDAVDYLASAVSLLQARVTAMALSSVLFLGLILAAGLLCVAAFIVLNVALGMWLTHVTGGAGWSLLILGVLYGFLGVLSGFFAVRWLKNLKS